MPSGFLIFTGLPLSAVNTLLSVPGSAVLISYCSINPVLCVSDRPDQHSVKRQAVIACSFLGRLPHFQVYIYLSDYLVDRFISPTRLQAPEMQKFCHAKSAGGHL